MSMLWILLFPLNVITSILCYLTNPIAVLFADERGELHGLWRYWQTWDDSVDVQWFVKEVVPECLRYDFDKHYRSSRETNATLASIGRDKGCVEIIDGNFTRHERWQRYCCRVLWLYRNCAYGFAFYLWGRIVNGANMTMLHNTNGYTLGYDKTQNILVRPWILHYDRGLIDAFFGWKIDCDGNTPKMAMIAGRIHFNLGN